MGKQQKKERKCCGFTKLKANLSQSTPPWSNKDRNITREDISKAVVVLQWWPHQFVRSHQTASLHLFAPRWSCSVWLKTLTCDSSLLAVAPPAQWEVCSVGIVHDGLDVVPREQARGPVHHAFVPAVVVLLDHVDNGAFLEWKLVVFVPRVVVNGHHWGEMGNQWD